MHTTYNLDTGKIIGYMDFSNDHMANAVSNGAAAGYGIVEDGGIVDRDTHYFNLTTEAITARPANPSTISSLTLSADSIDSITISSIPSPSTVTVESTPYTVTDGEFEFTTDFPGTYTIKIESFPYLPKEFVATAS